MTKHTATFTARSEDGEEFTIYEYTDFISARTREDPNGVIPGLKSLRTSDGGVVKWIEKGKYEIFQTGVIVTSDSPQAP